MAEQKIRVTVWDENPSHATKEIYPDSLRGAVAKGLLKLGKRKLEVKTAHLDEAQQGITPALLKETDVLVWWGHARHGEVSDKTAERVIRRVHNDGMGFVALHSAHYSKTFKGVLGANGHLKGGWRVTDPPEKEIIHVCAPWHPIAKGVEDFELPNEEMYGAPFDVPSPLAVILQSYFPLDGKTFPSGLCWTVGKGKAREFASGPGGGVGEGLGVGRVFYFRPGHETIGALYHPMVQRVIYNAVVWCGKGK